MEKQTADRSWKRNGLLKLFLLSIILLLGHSAFSQNNVRISWEYAKSLRCKPAAEYFFTSSDCIFYLDIEGINQEDIDLSVNRIPDYVDFGGFKKESLPQTETGRTGTRVILYFKFDREGDYQIPPVNVTIGHGMYSIPFEPVTVYTNPRTIQPKVHLDFANEEFQSGRRSFTIISGEHIIFTVKLQYATQLVNLRWAIPEDSLFREIKRFEIADKGILSSSFTPDIVPIVTFDWQPLVPGTYSLPKLIITASSYGGGMMDLSLPDYRFTVTGVKESDNETVVSDEYDYAFENPETTKIVEENPFLEIKNIDQLYSLRVKERHSMPKITRARELRAMAEEADGLKVGANEPSVVLHIAIGILLGILVVAVIVLFILKKIPIAAATLALTLFVFAGGMITGISCHMKYGLFKGGYVNTIPEESVQSGVTLQSGSRVKIEHEVNDWLFIRADDTSGWVKNDSVLVIR